MSVAEAWGGRSADHCCIAVADRYELAGFHRLPGDLDSGGGAGGRRIASRHGDEQHRNAGEERNRHDFDVGGSVCGKNR